MKYINCRHASASCCALIYEDKKARGAWHKANVMVIEAMHLVQTTMHLKFTYD